MKAWPAALTGLVLVLANPPALADDAGLPGGAFAADRYRILWETSPFAVASPVAVESVQYALVGAAELEGVSYASVVDKQSQEHFVVTSRTPSHGLSLVGLEHGTGPGSTFATLKKSDGILKLTLDTTVAMVPVNNPVPNAAPTLAPEASPQYPPLFRQHPRHARVFVPPIFVPRPPPSPP
jgi:hypothetical protein